MSIMNDEKANPGEKLSQYSDLTIGQYRSLNGLMNDILVNKYLELLDDEMLKGPRLMNTYFF